MLAVRGFMQQQEMYLTGIKVGKITINLTLLTLTRRARSLKDLEGEMGQGTSLNLKSLLEGAERDRAEGA